MKAIDQKLPSNEAEIDKKAKHCNTPSVDSGLPSERKESNKPDTASQNVTRLIGLLDPFP